MNLHQVIKSLIEAQNSHNSLAYVECFSETAIVQDEGQTHRGKAEIRQWIEKSNSEYQSVLKPLGYEESESVNVLSTEVSGDFPGSPVLLKFHFSLENGLISSLRITG